MPRRESAMNELVSLVFAMGRVVRDKVQTKEDDGNGSCHSLLGFEVLRYVEEAGRPHMRDVARHFHVTPPSATLMVDGLVKGKMLRRILDPKDRRSVRLALTPRGKKAILQGMANKVKGLTEMFKVLTPSERLHFAAMLRKVVANNS